MKRNYSKPEILFESFTLSTNIAGTCEGIVGNPTKGSCAVAGTGGINIFSGTVTACEFTPTDMGGKDDDIWDTYCYHVHIDDANLFNS